MTAITREEQYLAYLNGIGTSLPKPITRVERYLYDLCVKGGIGGGVTDEQIKSAVDAYLNENPVQISWNDLTDKPFGEETAVLYEWDGSTEGLENISGMYYKVTDRTITAEELLGSIATINGLDHEELDNVLIIEQSFDIYDTYISVMENGVLIVFEDTTWAEGIVLTKGIWHVNPTQIGMYVAKCEKQGIKKLDEKYLPKDTITEWIDEYINEALGGEY